MTFAYFTLKSGNLNILGLYDTQVSEPGPPWPSCLMDCYQSSLVILIQTHRFCQQLYLPYLPETFGSQYLLINSGQLCDLFHT